MKRARNALAVGRSPSRRERELEFRNRLVVEAAEEVFATRGFQAAGMDEIARRAEVSLATLYKLFGGKEELFAAVVAYRHEQFLAEIEEAVAAVAEPRERLDRLVSFVFEYFERHREAFRIYVGATHGFPWQIQSELGEQTFARYLRFLDVVADLLREGAAARIWAVESPRRLATAIVGVLNNLLTLRHTATSPPPLADEVAFASEAVRRLVGGPPPAPAGRTRRGKTRA